jgi:hypothetical protein
MTAHIQMAATLVIQEQPQNLGTPIWVPAAIVILMLVLFVWGITRADVIDENLPDADSHELAGGAHDDENDH